MTNRDRDSVAKLLREIADRLEKAPESSLTQGQKYAAEAGITVGGDTFISHYQAARLADHCRIEADAIRHAVEFYLTARPPKRAGRR